MIMNTGDARSFAFPNDGIIMGLQDVVHARQMLPNTKLITVHTDVVNHMSVYRKDYANLSKQTSLKM